MKAYEKAPALPGAENAHNLIPDPENPSLASCPCCGAMWKGGKPWSDITMTPAELAQAMGISQQAVTSRIRGGSIAAYLGPQARNTYLIPIYEVKRLEAEAGVEVLDAR